MKLGDFGFARSVERENLSRTFCGSTVYAAPEILTAKHEYDPRYSDTWSCGIVLYAMFTAKMPFGRDLLNKFVKLKIVEGKNIKRPPISRYFIIAKWLYSAIKLIFSTNCTSEYIRNGNSSDSRNIII